MKSVGHQTSNMGNWKCSERRNQLPCSVFIIRYQKNFPLENCPPENCPPRKWPPRKLPPMNIPPYENFPLWKLPPRIFPSRKLPSGKIPHPWENYPQWNPLPTYKSYKWNKKQKDAIFALKKAVQLCNTTSSSK